MIRLRLAVQTGACALVGFGLTLIWWAGGGHRYYWPVWYWIGALVLIASEYVLARAAQAPSRGLRWFTAHAGLDLVTGLLLIVIWVVTTPDRSFWPVYPLVGLGLALAFHALSVFGDGLLGRRELSERVDELTRSRRGVLDVQDAQLRRIERDLHDGAQARLVALTMQLGRAQERVRLAAEAGAAPPDLGPLLGEAQAEAQAAITELRELARGIAPPLLADRGLRAAVEALAQRSAVTVELDGELARRPPSVIENAAYFIAAESLTNVAKHADGASVRLSMREERGRLVIDVSDNGPGGADPAGGGLTGLRQRVDALDGLITVNSPAGHGTWIHVELPCGW